MPKIPLSIYIHFPWCLNKCPYCDFNSFKLSDKADLSKYVDKLLLDIELEAAKTKDREITSIYFGGGTPSLLSPEMIARIIEKIEASSDIEISLEANPGTIDLEKCRDFRAAGINRFSIGVQSFNDNQLKRINRIHSAAEAIKACEMARVAGFSNLNIDLMFGLPAQNVENAIKDLQMAINFSPEHISWYQLTLEKGISFDCLPENEQIWAIQQAGQDLLQSKGIEQYEVSAYSKSSENMCQHNLNYWQYGDYIGVGAGAHGKLTSGDNLVKRRVKISDPLQYTMAENLVEHEEVIDREKIPSEFMFNALRLYRPINYRLFQERTGFTIDAIKEKLDLIEELGLIKLEKDFIVTTNKGKNFLNDVLEIFV